MSYEEWGDEDHFTSERVEEIGRSLFRTGVQMCREMMARFVEEGGDATTAASIRANWNPAWGDDPGRPSDDDYERQRTSFDMWDWTP